MSENITGLWNYSYQCNKSNEEFFVQITNKLAHVNQLSANLASLNGTGDDGFLHTYCHGASNKECGESNSTRGFTDYKLRTDEIIELYLFCAGAIERNITLTVTAKYLYSVDEIDEGLSGGGIAGIVIACIIVFVVAVGILVSQKGVGGLRCCKNKTQQLPDDSPRVPNDIDRRETGLVGHPDHHANNPVQIQPSAGKERPSNAPLIDELMGATSAPFPDLNSTGQQLLSSTKNKSDQYNTNSDKNAANAHVNVMPTSPSVQGGLPSIHQDKKAAAQQWNALDSDIKGNEDDDELGKLADMKSSKRELTKDRSEGKE